MLQTLRPYHGLRDDVFHDLVFGLTWAMWHSREGDLDRQLVAAACYLNRQIRLIGTNEDSALRRNHLIEDDDLAKLREWLRIVDDLMERTLMAPQFSAAVQRYAFYLGKFGGAGAHPSFEDLFLQALAGESVDDEDWQAGLAAFARLR